VRPGGWHPGRGAEGWPASVPLSVQEATAADACSCLTMFCPQVLLNTGTARPPDMPPPPYAPPYAPPDAPAAPGAAPGESASPASVDYADYAAGDG
jgi:hypothetical protein